jgi:hypothetical protein
MEVGELHETATNEKDVTPTHTFHYTTPSNPQKLALPSPTSGGRSVGIVRLRTMATEFSI